MARCKDCAYFDEGGNCHAFKLGGMDPSGPSCQLFSSKMNIRTCELCGAKMVSGIIYQSEKGSKYICGECSKKSGTCALCTEVVHCEFETSPSSTPKIIQQKLPNGFAAQSKNPARIEETCKNCTCWDKENNVCTREVFGTCGNYKSSI